MGAKMLEGEELIYDAVLVEGRLGDNSVCWTAYHPALRGCTAAAKTPEEAMAGLTASRASWLIAAERLGRKVPAPPAPPTYPGLSVVYLARADASQAVEPQTESESFSAAMPA